MEFDFETFGGFKVDYVRPLTNDKILFHQLHLQPGEDNESSYNFVYQTGSPVDLIAARVDSDLGFFMRAKNMVTPVSTLGFTVQSQEGSPEPTGVLESDVLGRFSWTNIALVPSQGSWRFSYNGFVTPKLVLGSELEVAELRGSSIALGGKYIWNGQQFAAYASPMHGILQLNYIINTQDPEVLLKQRMLAKEITTLNPHLDQHEMPTNKGDASAATAATASTADPQAAKPADADNGLSGSLVSAGGADGAQGAPSDAAEAAQQPAEDPHAHMPSFGTELVLMPNQQGMIDSSVKFAVRQKIDQFNIITKVDTNLKLATSIEHRLPFGSFAVVGSVDHKKKAFTCGMQLSIQQ